MNLDNWKPKKEPVPFSSMFIASRRSGKSTLIRELFINIWSNQFDSVIVMCPTNFEGFYEEFVFGNLFFNEFNPIVIESVMNQQEKLIKEGKKPIEVLLILDDCSDDKERNADAIQKIYTKGRHLHISVVFSTQETTLTGTVWRNNSDFIVIGKQLGGRGRENIVDNFLLGMPEPEDIPAGMKERIYLRQLLKKNTADHSFIVLSFTSDQNDFKHNVFKYKANLITKKKRKTKKQEKLILKYEEEELVEQNI